jgi:hypothetical protein
MKYYGKMPLKNEYALAKIKDRNVKHVLSGGGYYWDGSE